MTITLQGSARTSMTAELILTTAERLYAERGIDAVSMREISREAGQRNPSALQYHFSTKSALISAILTRRMNELDYRRLEFLNELEGREALTDLRSLIAAMFWPMAESLKPTKRPITENWYIRFVSEVQRHPEYDLIELGKDGKSIGLNRIYMLIGKQLPQIPAVILQQRFVMAISNGIHALSEFERLRLRRRGSRRPFDIERAIENLIDMITGALSAPVSDAVLARIKG